MLSAHVCQEAIDVGQLLWNCILRLLFVLILSTPRSLHIKRKLSLGIVPSAEKDDRDIASLTK